MKYDIEIYTDGACSGNPGPGGWGALVLNHLNDTVCELGGDAASTTNNRMEMQAAISALQSIADFRGKTILYTDSKYMVQGITSWVYQWSRNGWRTKEGKSVENQDLWEELKKTSDSLRGKLFLEWQHIPGHAGIIGNERVDQIAVNFCQTGTAVLFAGSRSDYAIDIPPLDISHLNSLKAKKKKPPKKGYYLSYVDGNVYRDETWSACEARVKGRSGAKFKKCRDQTEEAEYLKKWGV